MVAELQHGGRAGLDAQLVLDRDAVHVVARAQRTVGIDQELGHDEQRNALHAFRRIGRAGQHQMDDVLGHVVLAVGDEDLGAEELVGAVALRHGAGAHQRQVGAGLRLGQVHGAGPLAGDEVGDEGFLLLLAAGRQQRFDGAIGQQRAQREGEVGRVQHLDAGRGQQLGQALAAELHGMLHALPAGLAELAEGFLEAGLVVTLPSVQCWAPCRRNGSAGRPLRCRTWRFLPAWPRPFPAWHPRSRAAHSRLPGRPVRS
jgi:hypothetical protein